MPATTTKRSKFTIEKPRMPRHPLATSDVPQTPVDVASLIPEHERKAAPSRRKRMSSRGICDCCHKPLTGHKTCYLCGILVGENHDIEPNPIYIKQERFNGLAYGPVWVCRCHNATTIYEVAHCSAADMKKDLVWSKLSLSEDDPNALPIYSFDDQPVGLLSADQAAGLCALTAARIRVLIKKKLHIEPSAYVLNEQSQRIRLYDQRVLALMLLPYIKITCPLIESLQDAPLGCWDEGVVASA